MWPYGVYTNKPLGEKKRGCWFYHNKWANRRYCDLTIIRYIRGPTPKENSDDTLAIPLEFC